MPIYPDSVDCRLFYSVAKRWQAGIDVTDEVTLIDNHFISSYPVFYIWIDKISQKNVRCTRLHSFYLLFFFTALFDKPLFNVFFLINNIFDVGPLDEFCHLRRTSPIKICFKRKRLTCRRNMGVVETNCIQVDAAHSGAISITRISRRLSFAGGCKCVTSPVFSDPLKRDSLCETTCQESELT